MGFGVNFEIPDSNPSASNIKYKKFDLRIIAKFQDNILKLTKKIINKI